MDNLALSVSKSITEYLEQSEKRFLAQQSRHEQNNELVDALQARLEKLEKKCEDLMIQNTSLRDELEEVKRRENESNITTKSDLEKMQTRVNECSDWVRLMAALTEEVQNLNKSRDTVEKELEDMHKNQGELNKLLDEQQRQINATAATAAQAIKAARVSATQTTSRNPSYNFYNNRVPARSPSTSSFFSSEFHNNHQPINTPTPNRTYRPVHQSPTSQYLNHMPKEDFLGSLDPNFNELSEISEDAECLIKNVNELNELHRSFEKNSICSDD